MSVSSFFGYRNAYFFSSHRTFTVLSENKQGKPMFCVKYPIKGFKMKAGENMKIGENIKTLRQSKNMTQEELAAKIHTTRQTISN